MTVVPPMFACRVAAATFACALLVSGTTSAQTMELDANDAIYGVNMMNLINQGDQMQQQRIGALLRPTGAIGGAGGVSPQVSRQEATLLSQRAMAADRFVPSESTLPDELATKLAAGDAGKRQRIAAELTSLLEHYRTVAREHQLAQNMMSSAYMYLVAMIYAANNGGKFSASSSTLGDLRFGLHNYVTLLQAHGHALSDAQKQRMYDAVALEGAIVHAATEAALRSGDAARLNAVGAQTAAIMRRLFGRAPDTTPFDRFATQISTTTLRMMLQQSD